MQDGMICTTLCVSLQPCYYFTLPSLPSGPDQFPEEQKIGPEETFDIREIIIDRTRTAQAELKTCRALCLGPFASAVADAYVAALRR